MKNLLAHYARAMDGISVFVGHACSMLLFACIAISALEVVLRYGFDSPTIWSTELAMILCSSAWVLSVGFVTQRHRHISITMLELIVGPRVWHVFRLLQMVIATGAVLTLSMALYPQAVKAIGRLEYSGTALNSFQPSYFKALLYVGCVFYILQLVANIIHWFQGTEVEASHGH